MLCIHAKGFAGAVPLWPCSWARPLTSVWRRRYTNPIAEIWYLVTNFVTVELITSSSTHYSLHLFTLLPLHWHLEQSPLYIFHFYVGKMSLIPTNELCCSTSVNRNQHRACEFSKYNLSLHCCCSVGGNSRGMVQEPLLAHGQTFNYTDDTCWHLHWWH